VRLIWCWTPAWQHLTAMMMGGWVWSIMRGESSRNSGFVIHSLLYRALVLQYISHPNIQLAHVQCFILMSSFLCSINCLPQAWILIGQAVRTGQDLGLHVCVAM
jgi:hypothetical protein